jgi:hypothetical protein
MIMGPQAQAAELYAGLFGSVHLDGWLQHGDAARFAQFTANYPAGTYIKLSGPGGQMDEMLEIGDLIQRRGFSTAVTARASCVSACAILFFSGHHAVIQRNSALCFHTPYDGRNGQAISGELLEFLADEIKKWGLTQQQAMTLILSGPPTEVTCATETWAINLGFRYSIVPSFGTAWRSCTTKFCLAIP